MNWPKMLLIGLLCSKTIAAYTQEAILRMKFDNPALQSRLIGSRVETHSQDLFSRHSINTQKDNKTIRTTDSEGIMTYRFNIDKTALRTINFFRDSTSLTTLMILVRPNDTLLCEIRNGLLYFLNNSPSAKVNRLLIQCNLLGEDSLLRRPLMRKVSEEMYANFMRDIADQKWLDYQATQDTTDATQNAYVQAALEGQYYQRCMFFQATKDWTDDMFNGIRINGRIYFQSEDSPTFKPKVRIVPHEDALLSLSYRNALIAHLGFSYVIAYGSRTEKMREFYDNADRELRELPKMREEVIASVLRFGGVWGDNPQSEQLMQRFERDFSGSPDLPFIKRTYWASQKAQKGRVIPPISLLQQDSTATTLHHLHGKKTLLLIWNTWEDSCQAALASVAILAQKYKQSKVQWATLCAKNRFDSWKEVLQKQWAIPSLSAHLYADYDTEWLVSSIFSVKRPQLVILDAEGRFLDSISPFDVPKITEWLK